MRIAPTRATAPTEPVPVLNRQVTLASRPNLVCILSEDAEKTAGTVFRHMKESDTPHREFEFVEFRSTEALELHVSQHGDTPLLIRSLPFGKSFEPLARTAKGNPRFRNIPGCVDWIINVSQEPREGCIFQCVASAMKWFKSGHFKGVVAKRKSGELWLPWGRARRHDSLVGASAFSHACV